MQGPLASLEIVILAAGQGRRMASSRPKVLHTLAGRPLLAHVLETARGLAPQAIHVVYGHGGEALRAAFAHAPVHWVEQPALLGTGDAVRCALSHLTGADRVLVMLGDVPLIQRDTLAALCQAAGEGPALLTFEQTGPNEYGRIVRDARGDIERIVEWRDADPRERALTEVNSGLLAARAEHLARWLPRLERANAQGEYYLTDIVALARADEHVVRAVKAADPIEVQGVNSRQDLAALERAYQGLRAQALLAAGVQLMDPARIDVRGSLQTGRDVMIDVDCVFEGDVALADGVTIGPFCLIRDARIGPGTRIAAHSIIEGADIAEECAVGPFARLRPGTRLAPHVRVGNFVETKATSVGAYSKMNHLSYIGDAAIGAHVNIGAGVITCNYDGANKHRTVIGDNAFIGSDTQLVAPVAIGAGATIGAGSTVTKDAPAGDLTLSRAQQKTVAGWRRPKKEGP